MNQALLERIEEAALGLGLAQPPARWNHRGRTRAGLDCIGVGVLSHRDAGLAIVDDYEYGKRPIPGDLFSGLERAGMVQVDPPCPLPGSFLVFLDNGNQPSHGGVCVRHKGQVCVVHASLHTPGRRVAIQALTFSLLDRLHSTWAHRDVIDG